jgi:metallo-beta-lactamase class B
MKTVLIIVILLQNLIFHSSFWELDKKQTRIKQHDGVTDSTLVIYKSDKLTVKKLSQNVYQHITFLNSETFGKVSCNGMILLDKNEALVFDTPSTNEDSEELLMFLTRKLKLRVKGVVATHFHIDCLGGLEMFHKYGITSHASKKTIASAKTQNYPLPQKAFDEKLALTAGNKKVYVEYFGEGHTRDNVIAWFRDDKIIFGGCLIKEQGATKGNLADANTTAWPETVKKIKLKYPDVRIIIPGHGETGGINLLDYTIGLFEAR